MEQARLANMRRFEFELQRCGRTDLRPGIYTIPEASYGWLKPKECETKGVGYVCVGARYADNPRGQIIAMTSGLVEN